MTYEQVKAIVKRRFGEDSTRYRIENDMKGMTEHISVWYGYSDSFQRDMLIDRYMIEYRHVIKRAKGRTLYDKEKHIELNRVAPHMFVKMLDQQCK
jgi:hypothetical protein